MPESRSRKKATYTPPPAKVERKPYEGDNPRWLVPTMLGLFVFGLLWIVVYYTAGNSIPGMSAIGALWNIVIGFAFIMGGFILAMRWK